MTIVVEVPGQGRPIVDIPTGIPINGKKMLDPKDIRREKWDRSP